MPIATFVPPPYPETLFPLQFRRQQAYPIDVDQVFYTTADRISYLTSPRRHAGQLVTDTEQNKVYVLNDNRDTWLPISSNAIQFYDEGVPLGAAASIKSVNLVGDGITAEIDGGGTAITINVPAISIKDEGGILGLTGNDVTSIDFVGSGVSATLGGSTVSVTIPALKVQANSVDLGDAQTINIEGAGATATLLSGVATVTVPSNVILFATSASRLAYLSSPAKQTGQIGIDNEEGGVYVITPGSTWVDITLPKIMTLTSDVTLAKTHKQAMLRMNNAGPLNVTFPTDASVNFEIGTTVIISQTGAGAVTLVAASGVTLNTPLTLTLGMRHGKVTATKVGANEWDIEGNLAP